MYVAKCLNGYNVRISQEILYPAQARWTSGRLDISNKTYETITSLGPAAPKSQSEDCPPPLPVKNLSRTMAQGRVGHASGGMVGCPEKCSHAIH